MIKRMVIFTSREDTPEIPDSIVKEFSNPRFYDKPRHNADAVYAPNNKNIRDDYAAAGKIVWGEEESVSEPVQEPVEETPEPEVTVTEEPATESPEEAEEPLTEPHWRDLSWPKMRSLAKYFTDEPIKSKDQAIEVLEKAESEGKI